jgi:hypothetical protein
MRLSSTKAKWPLKPWNTKHIDIESSSNSIWHVKGKSQIKITMLFPFSSWRLVCHTVHVNEQNVCSIQTSSPTWIYRANGTEWDWMDYVADLRRIPLTGIGVGDVREVSSALPRGYSHLVDGLMHHRGKVEKSHWSRSTAESTAEDVILVIWILWILWILCILCDLCHPVSAGAIRSISSCLNWWKAQPSQSGLSWSF